MNEGAIAERITRDFTAAAKRDGLWRYMASAWSQAGNALARALNGSFGRYGKVSDVITSHDMAFVKVKGYTPTDLQFEADVQVIQKERNTYILVVTGRRPDWGHASNRVIDETLNFSDFNARQIAQRVTERIIGK